MYQFRPLQMVQCGIPKVSNIAQQLDRVGMKYDIWYRIVYRHGLTIDHWVIGCIHSKKLMSLHNAAYFLCIQSHSMGFRLNPAFHHVKIIFGPMVFQLLRYLQEEFLHHSKSNLCATTLSCLRNALSKTTPTQHVSGQDMSRHIYFFFGYA